MSIPIDIEAVAKMLAGEHMGQDSDMTEVYWAPSDAEVRLVEVSGSVGDTGEVLQVRPRSA